MSIDELLEIVQYSMKKHYETRASFGLLQYFSLTDIPPYQLSRIALTRGKKILARMLYQFDDRNFWNLKELELEKHMRLLHSVRDHVVTNEEKLMVAKKLQEENFPLLAGTMFEGSRYYVYNGIEALSKEKIREELLGSYDSCHEKHVEVGEQSPAVLVKKR